MTISRVASRCLVSGMCAAAAAVAFGSVSLQTARSRPPVYVVYFTPADREPLPGYRERLDRVMTDVRAFYESEMKRNGYGPMTFGLERDQTGRLVVHLVKSAKAYAKGQTVEWDDVIAQVNRRLRADGIRPSTSHAVIFQNLVFTDGRKVECRAPYGGLGTHVMGRACVTDHVDVDPPNLARAQPVLLVNDREQPLNEYVMAQIGGVAHELGHALGLPHNMETPEENATLGRALMGSGNYAYGGERAGKRRGSFLTKATALLLSRHPLFGGAAGDPATSPRGALPELLCQANQGVMRITGRAQGDVPIAGLAVYLDPLPQRSDYDAASWTAQVSPDGTFRFDVPQRPRGLYELRLRLLHANGAQSVFEFPYRLDDPAHPPTGAIDRRHLYQEMAVRAYERRDAVALDAAVERLAGSDDLWLKKARLLRAALDRKAPALVAPADIHDDIKDLPLSRTRWESASVGWASPVRDVMPDSGYLMESGDDVHEMGLYAHAPSRFVFKLGGKWTRFEAGCGLQNWVPGSVTFQVKGDGRLLWECGKVTDWTERRVSVGVAGVQVLELIAGDAGDGKYADQAMWFSPTMRR